MAPSPGVCPACERRIRTRKNSDLRIMHYINETYFFGYKLKPCKGADLNGYTPSWSTIQETKRTAPHIRCLCCGKKVDKRVDFRPAKHRDRNGRICRGWSDNQ